MHSNQIPRLDVGYSAFVAAVTGFIVLGFSALNDLPVNTAIIGPGVVVIACFLLGYFVPTAKEASVALAGAIVVVVQAVISAQSGAIVDTALVSTAITAIANALFVYIFPALQPTSSDGNTPGRTNQRR